MFHNARSSPKRSIVLGHFSFLDPRQQETILLKAMEQANCPTLAMTVRNQRFAQTILGQTETTTNSVVFMGALFPAKSRRSLPRISPGKLLALYRLVQNSERVVLLSDHPRKSWSGLAQNILAMALRLRFRNTTALRAGTPLPRLLRLLKLRQIAADAPASAANWAFERLLKRYPEGVALQYGHVARALKAVKPTLALKSVLVELENHARKLERKPVIEALKGLRLSLDAETPYRIRCALSPITGEPTSRILQHLQDADVPPEECAAFTRQNTSQRPAGSALTLEFIAFLENGVCSKPGYTAWLSAKLSPEDSALTRFEWLLILLLRMPITSVKALAEPWADLNWRSQVHKIIPKTHPGTRLDAGTDPAIIIHGQVSSQTGLSQNLRMSHAALLNADIPVRLADRAGQNYSPINRSGYAQRTLQRNVALHHLNADRIPQEILQHYRFSDTYQIGFLLWELDRIPAAHRLAMEMLDEIWVPSIYLKNLYQDAFEKDVVFMRKALPLLSPTSVPKHASIMRFVVAFDAHSSTVRKNPIAAIHAFQAAFSGYRDVELIIKTTPVAQGHWGDPEGQMQHIAQAAQRDDRIRLITQFWPFQKLLGLIESADCLVSPHRAEGFGYMPAYAMKLGRPVICTDYSGTRDFCTKQTAFPVNYNFCEVPDGHAIFPTPDAQWAEIDVEHLAETMLRVYEFHETATKRAKFGQRLISSEYSVEKQANRYASRLQKLGLIEPVQAEDAQRLDAMFTKCS